MLPNVDEKGVRAPTACQADDMFADPGSREKSRSADAEGMAVNALGATGALERRPNGGNEIVPHERGSGAHVEDGVRRRASRTDAEHVRDGSVRAVERPGEAEKDRASDTRLGARQTQLVEGSTVSRVPTQRQIATLGLPGGVEGEAVLGGEFTDAHEAEEGGTAGGPESGAANGMNVQGVADDGQMPPFDRKTLESQAWRTRAQLDLPEDEIEERESRASDRRSAEPRDLEGDDVVEIPFDRVVGLPFRGKPVGPVGQKAIGQRKDVRRRNTVGAEEAKEGGRAGSEVAGLRQDTTIDGGLEAIAKP